MTSTYTSAKGFEKPGSGDYVGTWNTPVNSDFDAIDACFGAQTTLNAVSISGVVVLTQTQYRPPNIVVTGALTANVVYEIPTGIGGVWTVWNNTSGNYTITFASGGGGIAVAIPQGYRMSLVSDGSNIETATNASAIQGVTGSLRLLGSSSGYVGLQSPATASSLTFTMPAGDGSNGQVLSTNGSTILSWTTPAGAVASVSAGTTGLTPSSPASGAVVLGGVLNVANGGTGTTTSSGTGSVILGYSPTFSGTAAFNNTTTAGTATFSGNTSVAGFTVSSSNGANYGASWTMNNASGISLPNKSFRINPTGSLEYLNSNYTAVIATLTDTGNFDSINQTINNSQVLCAVNYNGYAPGLTGAGASGTWGINISGYCAGNAGSASQVNNAVTFNNSGTGNASGAAFNGSSAFAVSYNTIGAVPLSGAGASGTWGISITGSSTSCSGNSATATSATSATSATTATTATTANALNTSNTYQINGLGVGTGPSGTAGEIRATNNITAYYSDRRLKTDIERIPNALDKVMAISGVTFKSNDLAKEYGYFDLSTQVGVIAQEIAAVLPEIVVPAPFDSAYNEDGQIYSLSGQDYKTVQYEKLVPLLIEAIRELNFKVKVLERAAK